MSDISHDGVAGSAQPTLSPHGLKSLAQTAISGVHLRWTKRQLPNALAVYFHELEPSQMAGMAEFLGYFAGQGYRTVGASEYASAANSEKVLFVSFDDSFRGWHRALDLFARHEARCTFYVSTLPMRDTADASTIAGYFERIAYRGSDKTLSSAEVRELHAAGHAIGCHGHSHAVLSLLPASQWDEEIRASKDMLEQFIGAPVHDLSFPYGKGRHFSDALRQYCRDLGFRTVVSGISGMQHVVPRDPFQLHRTGWKLDLTLNENLDRLRVHAPIYGGMLGRCAVG